MGFDVGKQRMIFSPCAVYFSCIEPFAGKRSVSGIIGAQGFGVSMYQLYFYALFILRDKIICSISAHFETAGVEVVASIIAQQGKYRNAQKTDIVDNAALHLVVGRYRTEVIAEEDIVLVTERQFNYRVAYIKYLFRLIGNGEGVPGDGSFVIGFDRDGKPSSRFQISVSLSVSWMGKSSGE
jgi:hypothetical protein